MSVFQAFFIFIGGGLLITVGSYNAVRGMTNAIGYHKRFYPNHYITTPHILQKIFFFKKGKIPKFMLFHCYAIFFYFVLAIVEWVISFFDLKTAVGIFYISCCGFGLLEKVIFLTFSSIYRAKRFEQERIDR